MSDKRADMETFDWVRERSECSLPKVYERLKLEVIKNVKTRNELRPTGATYKFEFTDSGSSFVVILDGIRNHKAVTFILSEKFIEVQTESEVFFHATVSINDEGDCVLRVNGQDRKLWQVLKLALEHLFSEAI